MYKSGWPVTFFKINVFWKKIIRVALFQKILILALGQIHLPHLQIRKFFTDDSSIYFHGKVFLHLLQKFGKKWRKNVSWKFMDESSIKYLQIHKWTRWIRNISNKKFRALCFSASLSQDFLNMMMTSLRENITYTNRAGGTSRFCAKKVMPRVE